MNAPPVDSQRAPSPFVISAEDQRVIAECNREAFYTRCLPLAASFSGITLLAIRAGYLQPSPNWGAVPKVLAATCIGYFFGKFSYQQVCVEKLMAIPNSQLGAALRARKQAGRGGFQDALTLDLPGYRLPEESSADVYRDDSPPRTFTDLDMDRPYNQGLNDSFRLNVDSPQRPEDFILPPQAPTSNSYDDLRRQNREDYEKRTRGTYRPPEPSQRQYQPPQPAYTPPVDDSFDTYKPTNLYGDVFEK